MTNSTLRRVAGALTVVGALNWGLVALARFDLVAAVAGLDFGETNAVTRVVYGLVGLAGVVPAVELVRRERAPERSPAGVR